MTQDTIIGIGIFVVAALIIYTKYKKKPALKKSGVKTQGIVFKFEQEAFMPDSISFFQVPIIRFTTLDGTWITGSGEGIKSTFSPFEIGQNVTVYYNPQNPKEFVIEKAE